MGDLPEIDQDQVAAFWRRYLASAGEDLAAPIPDTVEPFGDSPALADELLALVLDGPKRATASARSDYRRERIPLPWVGRLSIATDGAGCARAVLRTTEVRTGPLSSVDEAFAFDEGEGDRTLESWLRDHESFFRRYLPTVGEAFSPEMETIFERFALVYRE
jgi:uncharacterized protein YhfF